MGIGPSTPRQEPGPVLGQVVSPRAVNALRGAGIVTMQELVATYRRLDEFEVPISH